MEVYLLRHGQSLANVARTSELDSALTQQGERQALLTAERLRTVGISRVYVSPLRRTLQTIAPFCQMTGLLAELYADICEYFSIRHPEYETFSGMTPDAINAEFPFIDLTVEFPCVVEWWPQCLEDHNIIYDRAVSVRNSLLQRFGATDHSILIVSHAETIGRLIEAFLRIPPFPEGPPWSENCGISLLRCPKDPETPAELIYKNDTSHLTGPMESQ